MSKKMFIYFTSNRNIWCCCNCNVLKFDAYDSTLSKMDNAVQTINAEINNLSQFTNSRLKNLEVNQVKVAAQLNVIESKLQDTKLRQPSNSTESLTTQNNKY